MKYLTYTRGALATLFKLSLGALAVIAILLVTLACRSVATSAPVKPSLPTASEMRITDIVGRTLAVKNPVRRMLLGDGRVMYVIAPLETEDPFRKVAGWAPELKTTDLDAFNKYSARFPQLANIPVFGSMASDAFSAEQAIALKPDVHVLNLDNLPRAEESGIVAQLAKAGIPTVVIDFRQYPLENTVPSIMLMGKLLDREKRAQEVVDFYIQQINQVYSRVEKIKKPKPNVFLYRAAGLLDCCATFGRSNLGLLIDRAGGNNIGSSLVPGWAGTINPEKVLVSNPDVIIATGSNWTHQGGASGYVSLGYTSNPEESRKQLQALASKPGWGALNAVKNNRFHAVWHQFYISPYHFVALQQFAKWIYPEEFGDVNPEGVFREFHQKFLPIDYSGAFWVTLRK